MSPPAAQEQSGITEQGDTIIIKKSAPVNTLPAQKPLREKEPAIEEVGNNRDTVPPVIAPKTQPEEQTFPRFSLFNYGKTIAVGPQASYFYYNEHIEIDPLVQQFRDQYLRSPKISGEPKSSEYGGMLGVNFGITRYLPGPHLLIRPRVALLVGMGNTYDGSEQGGVLDSAGVPVGIEFVPHKDQKDNIFLMGGCDIGYVFTNASWPTAVYSGLDAKLWYRDMVLYSEQAYVPPGTTMSETYYWFSVPIGAVITKPLSGRWLLGIEPRVDLMFFGQMQITEDVTGSDVSYNYPAVTLGSKASFRLDLYMQTRLGSSISLKFGPYAMLYGFGKSNTDTATASVYGEPAEKMSFWEPASASYWIGFNLQVLFLKNPIHGGPSSSPGQKESP
ncbi:MAG TPA: hypothetical protein VLX68_10525 [Chitinivibrionales bacterium]|nr:hypothetical protein [Chitinivibrionales bacterium]